jgi:D-beta-D-heptose 7-phosphate kinase/D-beta-D-heptose 1-phosphate adenosyltransferase
MEKIALVSGGFDPVHSGHIQLFDSARRMADKLVVATNSDEWLTAKKGKPFMPMAERLTVLSHLNMVDHAITFPNDANGTAINAIKTVRSMYPEARIFFCNGGDRTRDNIPEMDYEDDNLSFLFGVGGSNKANSSSAILKEWKQPITKRNWGHYRVMYELGGTKVKELVVEPGQKLSMQRHFLRNELWMVSEGEGALVRSSLDEPDSGAGGLYMPIRKHEIITIQKREWHQLINNSNRPLHLVEIQYGDICQEEDIERKS